MGRVADRHDQVAVVPDVVDVPGPQPGQRRLAALIASGSIVSAGRVPADAAGTAMARRHNAAARCERAELAVHTNSTRRAVLAGGPPSLSSEPGTSRR
jgi:hypothetical protein